MQGLADCLAADDCMRGSPALMTSYFSPKELGSPGILPGGPSLLQLRVLGSSQREQSPLEAAFGVVPETLPDWGQQIMGQLAGDGALGQSCGGSLEDGPMGGLLGSMTGQAPSVQQQQQGADISLDGGMTSGKLKADGAAACFMDFTSGLPSRSCAPRSQLGGPDGSAGESLGAPSFQGTEPLWNDLIDMGFLGENVPYGMVPLDLLHNEQPTMGPETSYGMSMHGNGGREFQKEGGSSCGADVMMEGMMQTGTMGLEGDVLPALSHPSFVKPTTTAAVSPLMSPVHQPQFLVIPPQGSDGRGVFDDFPSPTSSDGPMVKRGRETHLSNILDFEVGCNSLPCDLQEVTSGTTTSCHLSVPGQESSSPGPPTPPLGPKAHSTLVNFRMEAHALDLDDCAPESEPVPTPRGKRKAIKSKAGPSSRKGEGQAGCKVGGKKAHTLTPLERLSQAIAAQGGDSSSPRGLSPEAAAAREAYRERQLLRQKRGTATDPQSVAARNRRERISQKIRSLGAIVPNADKLDIATMLDQSIEYVHFLEKQVQRLSENGHVDLDHLFAESRKPSAVKE